MSKVFESLVLRWVDKFIQPHLDCRQFGSLAGTCTTDALVEMVHQWCEATDSLGTCARVLLLDYSKAFDLINHDILIGKLQEMGLPPHLVRWMAAFLLDRHHRVRIGEALSDTGSPNGGVPQGTLSGPKDFLVHINDLTTPCPSYKYVDGSSIFEVCAPGSQSRLQEAADAVWTWAQQNDMRINPSKTHELLINFSRNGEQARIPRITMNGEQIERTGSAKILGSPSQRI